ncbi:MAG: TIGR03545 family protein [Spirochaetaceae bacterium]|nr:TIGR03545 family protein [Spirochaetaceae bacterium]
MKKLQGTKKTKEPKTVYAKKLPKIYKKKYTEKKLEKKVLKHIYIAQDKDFVHALFEKELNKKGSEIFTVPSTKELSVGDLKRAKKIAKELKSQKGGFNIAPFIAVVTLCVVLALVVALFKNIVLEKILVSSLQGIFKAKTSVESVDIRFLDSSLTVTNLEQANRDKPMENLFQIGRLSLDFNLASLLKGKFHAQDLTVTDVALNTARKTSGELPIKVEKKDKKEKKEQSELSKKIDGLQQKAAQEMQVLFSQFKPETLLANIQDELQSPKLATTLTADVQEKIAFWKQTPNELKQSMEDFSATTKKVTSTNWNAISNLVELKSALETTNAALTQSKKIKEDFEKTTATLKADSLQIKQYSNEIQKAIQADKNLVDTKINQMRQLISPEGLKGIVTTSVESMMYGMFGNYYSYLTKLLEIALSAKGTTSDTAKKESQKIAKENHKRYNGRTIFFKTDTIPPFLIENVKASGLGKDGKTLIFSADAKEVALNQDIRNKPMSLNFLLNGAQQHKASGTIDTRKISSSEMFNFDYSGTGFPLRSDVQVFALEGLSTISLGIKASDTGKMTISGSMNMVVDSMTGMVLEQERLNALYQKALASIKNLLINFSLGYSLQDGLEIALINPEKMATQITNPIMTVLQDEIGVIANESKEKVSVLLSEKTKGLTDSLGNFTSIESAITGEVTKLADVTNQLEKKKAELTKKIEDMTKNAASNAASSALKNLLKK